MSFLYPYLLLLPLVFILLQLFLRPETRPIFHPRGAELSKLSPGLRVRLRGPLLLILRYGTLILLSVAAARPQRISVHQTPVARRNLIMALDVSASMSTPDFQDGAYMVSRLDGVRTVVSNFVSQRPADRLGLVIFGSKAFLECPLTNDHALVRQMVENLQVGMAGEATALGEGLGLGLKRIEDISGNSKSVILLTDGVNTSGAIDPLQAAKVAKELGVKVHTIGIGSAETVERARRGFTFDDNLKKYEFDEKTLQAIAELTGGVYFNASDMQGLEAVYDQIEKLERTDAKSPERTIASELFVPYALAALAAFALYLLSSSLFFMKVP